MEMLLKWKKSKTAHYRLDQKVWWMTSPQEDAWEWEKCGRWCISQKPLHVCLQRGFHQLALSLHCKADLFKRVFVAFGICVQNGEICAMCKYAVLLQTW
jgi:hypothetical protein